MDRRYFRTERLLIQSMQGLVKEKPYRDILVKDIVERSDIARKTFYAHYVSKDALLWSSLEANFHEIEKTMGELRPDTLLAGGKPLSYPMFKHVAEYALFYKSVLIDEPEEARFVLQFMDYIAQQSFARHQPLRDAAPFMSVPPTLIAEVLSGALIGSLRWWLKNDLSDTTEQMAYRFSQLMAPGVLQTMGLDE